MYSTEQLQDLINNHISVSQFPLKPQELYDPIRYILSLGGKRMRPALLLMACDIFEGSVLEALDPALAIEIFHNFTLVHDDIMDKAPLRRGKETVHKIWNENVAILSGDVMLVEAYSKLAQLSPNILKSVLTEFNGVARGVCEGQQMDMNFEQLDNVGISDYMEMIRLKTAILLGGALKIGAIIAGANEHDAALMYTFGEHLGIAFQLQDDILDVYGDPDKFGKQVGGDILANKKTYLLLSSLDQATAIDKDELNYWIAKDSFEAADKITAVTDIYDRVGARIIAEKEMSKQASLAIEALEKVGAPVERKAQLRNFAAQLLIREN